MSAEEFLGMWLVLTRRLLTWALSRCFCFLYHVLCGGSGSRARSRPTEG
jgi:hypothetical protein